MNRRRWSLSVALPRPHWESDEFAQYTPDARATMLIVCQTTRNYHPSDIYPLPPRCINDSYVRLPMLHAGENSFGPARGCLLLLFEHATPPPFFHHICSSLCARLILVSLRFTGFFSFSRPLLTFFIIHPIQFRGGTSFLGG